VQGGVLDTTPYFIAGYPRFLDWPVPKGMAPGNYLLRTSWQWSRDYDIEQVDLLLFFFLLRPAIAVIFITCVRGRRYKNTATCLL
jgi:hypothetical protein